MNIIPPEFKHQDSRRKLTQILTANIKQVNYYECQPGQELGNHFHTKYTEFFCPTKGYLLIGNEFGMNRVEEGQVFAVFPNEAHTIKTEVPTTFITLLTSTYQKELDG